MQLFKKKEKVYKEPKPIKFKPKFTEIWLDINNFETQSFKRFKLENVKDKYFIYNGSTYHIDSGAVERLIKYDPLLELLPFGIRKIKRYLQTKRIGFIQFEKAKTEDMTIEPFTRNEAIPAPRYFQADPDSKVKSLCSPMTPPLLKALAESPKFRDYIRSLKAKAVPFANKKVLVIVVMGVLIAIVVIIFALGIIKIPGVGS